MRDVGYGKECRTKGVSSVRKEALCRVKEGDACSMDVNNNWYTQRSIVEVSQV